MSKVVTASCIFPMGVEEKLSEFDNLFCRVINVIVIRVGEWPRLSIVPRVQLVFFKELLCLCKICEVALSLEVVI